MDGTKITRQTDGRIESYMVSRKVTRQRMDNEMVGTKITHPRDGWHKNNSPKGWTNGESYGRQENNLPKDGELNGQHENNSPKGWTGRE